MALSIATQWMIFFFIVGLMAAYIVAYAMDNVMGRVGFGVFGNMAVLVIGYLAGSWLIDRFYHMPTTLEKSLLLSIVLSFLTLLFLVVFKRLFWRH